MGYTTYFSGQFAITPPLSKEQVDYLVAFSEQRRMTLNLKVIESIPDPKREAVGLPIGEQGCYFVAVNGQPAWHGIADYNSPPSGQPGLWCDWTPTDDGSGLEWNGGEKFYDYTEWLEYIVEHFLQPWGRVLSGSVEYRGEEADDRGTIYAKDNKIELVEDQITNPGPSWGDRQ